MVTDRAARLVDCNDACCRILGRNREELVGHSISDWEVPGKEGTGRTALAAMEAGQSRSWEMCSQRGDGSMACARIHMLVLNRTGDLYVGIVEDISEPKQTEAERTRVFEQVREKTAFLERAHQLARICTFVVDPRRRIVGSSAELARMLGAGDEAFEMSIEAFELRFTHPDDVERHVGEVESALVSGPPALLERRLIRTDGTVIWVATSSIVEVDEEGQPLRVIGVAQDISERVRLLEDLRASRARVIEASDRERLRVVRDLHDGAQQRLIAMLIGLSLAREQAGEGEIAARLDAITQHAQAGLEELRALAHGAYPAVLQDRGLGDAFRSLAREASVRVSLVGGDLARCPPTVGAAVYFCAREAIQNATKHAGRDAIINVTLERHQDGLEFEVADDGAGYDVGDKSDGFGLLSMRDRINAVGGELKIISAPGKGTRVRGTVPVVGDTRADERSDNWAR